MKKTIALVLSAVMCLGLLAGCGSEPQEPELTGAELAAHYRDAIDSVRSDEDKEYNPVSITGEAEDLGSLVWEVLGFTAEDCDAYAFALSLMNIKAYCVGLFKPVEGSEETVMGGLEAFVAAQQQSFQSYLPDQGEIADNAILKTLDDGTVMLVMSEGWDEVAEGITAAL